MQVIKIFGKKTVIVLSFLALLTTACTKQVPGPKGDPGTPGGTGNAKQFSSTVFSVAAKDWSAVGRNWQALAYVAEITDNVVAKGEVKVYILVDGYWWPLPYAVSDIFTQYSFEKGIIKLNTYKDHGTPPAPATASFKVVIYYP
ncbi:MAG: hypothetical protein IT236_14190 [Bacteroidia bacterium]|nr:hypothetical protein [Bacteroidia bacterium]